jgi:hypothetical protein
MNKRQKKKAYKKRYGHNPPTKDYLYKTYGLDTAVVADRMAEAFRNAFTAIREAIEAVAKNITAVWEKTKENIQTMSDEEYAEFLEELKPEARGWAAAIRMAAKKDQAAAAGQEKEGGI